MALTGARDFRNVIPATELIRLQETGVVPLLKQPDDPNLMLTYNVPATINVTGARDPRLEAREQLLETIRTKGLTYSLHQRPEKSLGFWDTLLRVGKEFVGIWSSGGASLASTAFREGTQVDPYKQPDPIIGTYQPRGVTMAFQDGDSWGFGDIFQGVNQALQGGLAQNLLNIGSTALSGFVQQQFAPQPVSYGGAQPVMASVPAVLGAGRAVATVGRGFFNRFPNLATSLQGLRNRGANVSRSSLYSAMRRFGPEMLVSGGILTAAAVSELAVAGPGRRRMNPGNVKALRRAHRRLKSFHHLCQDNDMLYKRSRRK